MFSLYGSEMGRIDELNVLRKSGLNDILQNCHNIEGYELYIIGDKTYIVRPCILVGYGSYAATTEQKIFKTMRQDPVSLIFIAYVVLFNFKHTWEIVDRLVLNLNVTDLSFLITFIGKIEKHFLLFQPALSRRVVISAIEI